MILAQLGEHLPYKQRVTGSSPVGPTRSKDLCRRGGTGRRTGLKILRSKIRTGSIPVAGIEELMIISSFFLHILLIYENNMLK